MLRQICELANTFERKHGYRPNVLYITERHFGQLRLGFADPYDIDMIVDWLQMDVVITPEPVAPYLDWEYRTWQRQSGARPSVLN